MDRSCCLLCIQHQVAPDNIYLPKKLHYIDEHIKKRTYGGRAIENHELFPTGEHNKKVSEPFEKIEYCLEDYRGDWKKCIGIGVKKNGKEKHATIAANQVNKELVDEYKAARGKKDELEAWKKIHSLNARGKRGELTARYVKDKNVSIFKETHDSVNIQFDPDEDLAPLNASFRRWISNHSIYRDKSRFRKAPPLLPPMLKTKASEANDFLPQSLFRATDLRPRKAAKLYMDSLKDFIFVCDTDNIKETGYAKEEMARIVMATSQMNRTNDHPRLLGLSRSEFHVKSELKEDIDQKRFTKSEFWKKRKSVLKKKKIELKVRTPPLCGYFAVPSDWASKGRPMGYRPKVEKSNWYRYDDI